MTTTSAGFRVCAAAIVLLACGAAPRLSRFASTLPVHDEASTLDAQTRAHLEGSLGDAPSAERVGHRLALIEAAPVALGSRDARALLESTLDWIERLRRGEGPGWVEPACIAGTSADPFAAATDVIGELTGPAPSAMDRTVTAIRGTRTLVERAARGTEPLAAWRDAMISLHGTPDECVSEGEAGALAAAVRAYRDAQPGPIRAAADERNYFEAPIECHVATLDGGARLVRGPGEVFARACWARGGPADAECTPGGDSRGGHRASESIDGPEVAFSIARSWYAWVDSLTDAEVVVVLVGSVAQAHRVVVVRRDGAWRALEVSLAWTS